MSNASFEFCCGTDNGCDDVLTSVILLSTFQDLGQHIRVCGFRAKEVHAMREAHLLLLLGGDGRETDGESFPAEVLMFFAPAMILLQAGKSKHRRLQRKAITM